MKASFKFILAALAATAALAACTKETTPPDFENDKVNPVSEGSRVIAVSFGSQTKTTLEGFQPKFVDEKDTVLISNGKAVDTCKVKVEGDVATITTNLTGPLTAVYPYTAAGMNGSNPKQIDTVLVSTEQDGTFANANICMAKEITDKAVFENKTALFEITPPAGAKSFTITSLNPVEDGVARTGTAKAINTDGATDEARRIITVSNDALTTFYVFLVPGVNLSNLSFDAGGTYGMKGIPTSRISTDQTAANTKYTINDENWHSYVEIEMTVGSDTKTYKWATENVGATTSNPNGDYFMWGYTIGHTATTTGADAFKDQTFQEGERGNNDDGFAWSNYIKFTSDTYTDSNEKVFTKYVPLAKASEYGKDGTFYNDKTTLDLADDAAMPIGAEPGVCRPKRNSMLFRTQQKFGTAQIRDTHLEHLPT